MTLSICVPTYQREDMLRELLSMIPETAHVFVSDNGGSLSLSFVDDENNDVSVKRILPEVPMFSNWEDDLPRCLGDIVLVGRFGQWKYFWSDDCVFRGKQIGEIYARRYVEL